jgi:hypothetical protein
MIVSDIVGILFFSAVLAWNLLSPAGSTEITILCLLSIGCTVAFEIAFPKVSARCTQHPWRDLFSLLFGHELMLVYVGNWLITIHIARSTLIHLPVLEHFGGYVNHLCVLWNRNSMDMAQRAARTQLVREEHGMSYGSYVLMLNLVTFPHNVLRYHVRWMLLSLAEAPPTPSAFAGLVAKAQDLRWTDGTGCGLQLCALYLLLFALYRKTPLPMWLAKIDCRWYQHWHRWFHEDPLLWRTVHKFHHCFKRPTPLVSSTETHIEWCMSWAAFHTFCNPFYQLNLFLYDAVGAIEMHSHDVLSERKVIGGADGYHPLHHKHGSCNYSVPDWDRYYGTITRERAFDDYFPHRPTIGAVPSSSDVVDDAAPAAVDSSGSARRRRSPPRPRSRSRPTKAKMAKKPTSIYI